MVTVLPFLHYMYMPDIAFNRLPSFARFAKYAVSSPSWLCFAKIPIPVRLLPKIGHSSGLP
jgi:hypothetical protein